MAHDRRRLTEHGVLVPEFVFEELTRDFGPALVAVRDCPACGGAYLDDDGPVCACCGRRPTNDVTELDLVAERTPRRTEYGNPEQFWNSGWVTDLDSSAIGQQRRRARDDDRARRAAWAEAQRITRESPEPFDLARWLEDYRRSLDDGAYQVTG